MVCQYLCDFNLILHGFARDVHFNILIGPNAFVTEKWPKNSEELSFQVFSLFRSSDLIFQYS